MTTAGTRQLLRRWRATLWSWVYFGLAVRMPVSYHTGGRLGQWLRSRACRHLFRHCGHGVNVERGAYVEHPGRLEIGDRSGLGIDAYLDGPIRIGMNVMMAPRVTIFRRNHALSRTDVPMIDQGFDEFVPLEIEDDVWIGYGVIIVPSVKRIGRGSVLAAGAVVVKDVPPYTIVGGNPARVLKTRTDVNQSLIAMSIAQPRSSTGADRLSDSREISGT